MNVIATDGKLTKSSKSAVATLSLKAGKQVKTAMPYFERGQGAEPIGTSDIFYLKLKQSGDIGVLNKMASQLGVQVREEIPYTPCWFVLSILGSDFSSSIEASNYFYETGLFDDVDPAFMFDFAPNSANNFDPMFSQQWGLDNLTYSDIDINVIPAWEITRGAGIKVAVVDQGIDADHNDLDANIIISPSWDAQGKKSPSVFKSGKFHGTYVAGIISSERNGSQVMGVAYESKILRVSHDLAVTTTISGELASGINWAWQNGADVISCSWGDGSGSVYNMIQSAVLDRAIADALRLGRNRKGCVVVFSAGNEGNNHPAFIQMSYPANSHTDILAVGAVEPNGSRWYKSSYGSALDVMAPGVGVLSTMPGNDTASYNGTSSAVPYVSGVAALMLSVKPTLTAWEISNIIERTARKVGGYNYSTTSGRPNGTWNEQMGYGLVDAYAAVLAASSQPPSPPSISCGGGQRLQGYELERVLQGMMQYPTFWVTPGSTAYFGVDGGGNPGETYEWDCPYLPPYTSTDRYFGLDTDPYSGPMLYPVKCRAHKNGLISDWTTVYLYVANQLPQPYNSPMEEPEPKPRNKLQKKARTSVRAFSFGYLNLFL